MASIEDVSLAKCDHTGRELFCPVCKKNTIFSTIAVLEDPDGFDRDFNYMQYYWSKHLGQCNFILRMMDGLPVDLSNHYAYDHTGSPVIDLECKIASNIVIGVIDGCAVLEAPSFKVMCSVLEFVVVKNKPLCLSVNLKTLDDRPGHLAVLAIYPDGFTYLIDPNGSTSFYGTKAPVFENILEIYLSQVVMKSDVKFNFVRQSKWLGNFNAYLNININREKATTNADLLASGRCAMIACIFASLVVEKRLQPYDVYSYLTQCYAPVDVVVGTEIDDVIDVVGTEINDAIDAVGTEIDDGIDVVSTENSLDFSNVNRNVYNIVIQECYSHLIHYLG
jgi:hypothetical protein